MPAPLDLTGQRFGKLTALRLLKDRDAQGRRVWACRCACGGTATVSTMLLQNGHTKSCGCLVRSGRYGRPFRRTTAKQAHRDKERIADDVGEWLAPRVAARYVGASYPTLVKWQKSCPLLDRDGIQRKPFKGAYNRTITYYLKADLDRVIAARATRKPIPDYPGLVHAKEAAREIGVSVRTLCRLQKDHGPAAQTVRLSGKSSDGRPLPRTYVPKEFADACKADRRRERVPADEITVKEAAAHLGTSVADVHNIIAAGLLAAHVGQGTTVSRPRNRSTTLHYYRKATLVSRAAVDELKAEMGRQAALPASAPRRPGRQRGPLRLAAEALRDAAESNTATSPPVSEEAGQPRRRRGRRRGHTQDWLDRKKGMLEGWDQGKYDTKAEAARACGFHKQDATKIINEHERKKSKKQIPV